MVEPYYQDHLVTIYHGDCREMIATVGNVDLVLTDPPYGTSAGSSWKAAPNGTSRLWDHPLEWDKLIDAATVTRLVECARYAIIWGGQHYALPPSRGWLVWDKMQSFGGAEAELAWTNLNQPTKVFRLSRIDAFVNRTDTRKQHPTEKPTSLMRWCLGFVPWATTVLDPFMGSGSTLRAAKDLGRKAIGIEIEERYCEAAARRMGQEAFAL